jgi:hypothetical protein
VKWECYRRQKYLCFHALGDHALSVLITLLTMDDEDKDAVNIWGRYLWRHKRLITNPGLTGGLPEFDIFGSKAVNPSNLNRSKLTKEKISSLSKQQVELFDTSFGLVRNPVENPAE